MDSLLEKIEVLRARLSDLWQLLDIDRQLGEVVELKLEMVRPDFWQNRERAVEVGRRVESLESEAAKWQALRLGLDDLAELALEAKKEGGDSLIKEIGAGYDDLERKFNGFEFLALFGGKYDRLDAILSIHAGTGGTDAQDWAEMLLRMFERFAEKKGFSYEIMDYSPGNEAGLKSVTVKFSGLWAYGYLRSETGVHRLVRISPFDAEGMRHTSFALVEVIPDLPETEVTEIPDEDLKVDTFRSSGPGGQNVNKTESAIRITHIPTNIIVACQTERSQHQNRENAMKIIRSKLHQLHEAEREAEEKKLKGDNQKADWGRQIRSYVLQPYQMVKDHRTGQETAQVREVLDGDLEPFIEAFLRFGKKSV